MTKQEAVLISAYTGYLLVADFSDVAEYCQKVLGRPIYTHETQTLIYKENCRTSCALGLRS